MARTGTVSRWCKNHQKDTIHGVYEYKSGTAFRCLDCAKEQRTARRKDPEKYAHDKAYTRGWARRNSDHVKQQARERRTQYMYDKLTSAVDFIDEYEDRLFNILQTLESKLTLDDLQDYCARYSKFSFDEVFEYIYRNKLSELKDRAAWSKSTLVKYHHGVQDEWKFLPEPYKEKIRAEYKTMALKEARGKMDELLAKI